ncbi:Mediator of RNA polymerase II transcription subunit 6 [Dirofilaria immitis]|nr:Mediator of RNA polymerase II transcription subunit 6 [Dirofilaria immitis]
MSIILQGESKTMQAGGPSRSVMIGQSQGTYMGVPNVTSQPGSAYQQAVSMLHQSFKNPNWPPNFITPDNVLDYFCDPGNVFMMFLHAISISECKISIDPYTNVYCKSMQGIQYTVVGTFPPLYVILKQRRNSPTNVTPLAYYYIVNGTVYQCPDIYTYIQSKLISIVDPLRQALEQARNFNRFNIAKGYYWEFKDSDSETVKKTVEEKPQLARSTFYQRTRTDQILRELFIKFPPPDDVVWLPYFSIFHYQQFNFDGNEIAEENETVAANDIVEKPVHGSSVNNQDLTEDPAMGINQQPAFTSPSTAHVIPTNRSTGESSSGPLSFPETAPVLGTASTDSRHETDAKRFRGS